MLKMHKRLFMIFKGEKTTMSNKKSDNYNFSVKIRHYGNDIEYVVIFDDFPDLIGAGDTIEEAIQEAKENLEVYITCHNQ